MKIDDFIFYMLDGDPFDICVGKVIGIYDNSDEVRTDSDGMQQALGVSTRTDWVWGNGRYILAPSGDDPCIKARENGLTAGIALAVGLMHKHGMNAQNILSECGIADKKELRDAGVEQFDLDNIGDLLPEEA